MRSKTSKGRTFNHEAQLLTCMKLARVRTGLLINFNVRSLRDGIKRFVL